MRKTNTIYTKIGTFLIIHADSIQKRATEHHKIFLGSKNYRTEIIQKYQIQHTQIVKELARHLEESDVSKSTVFFKKMGEKMAKESVTDGLSIEEAVDGIIFLKQAIWEKIHAEGLLKNMSVEDFYELSQRIGILIDVVTSTLTFAYNDSYIKNISSETSKRDVVQKELEMEQLRLRDLLTQAPAAIAVLSGEDLTFTLANTFYQKVVGKTEKELLGKPGRDALPELISQGIWDIVTTVYQTGKPFVGKDFPVHLNRLGTKKLDLGYFDFVIQPIKKERGIVEGIFIHAVEVTDQVLARKQIEESDARLKLAQKAANIGTYDWDLKTNTIVWTPELEMLYGLKPGGFKNTYANAVKLSHKDDKKRLHKATSQILKEKKDLDLEYRVLWPDKSIHWLRARGKIFLDAAGNPEKMLGIVIDTTEQKKSQEIQERFARIVESSDDAIISKSIDGLITSWNRGAEQLYGYTASEIIGKPVSVLMPPSKKDDFPMIMKELVAGRKVEHYETQRMTKDGRTLDVSITVSPMRDKDGKIIGASKIARDITEKKRLEQQKDDFVSIATHELKTPVTSIKAYAQVLQQIFMKKDDTRSAEYLGKMDAQLNKLTNLISDLLDVNKIQSGQLQFHQERFDFDELIEEVVEELQRTTDKHLLIKELAAAKNIIGDRDRIGQVVTNLLANAIKYSPHSEKIIVKSEATTKEVTVCVQDFGVGIPKDMQDKVFQKFFRVSGPREDTFPGMGLGLYISSEIIKRQGGRIWVESTKGKGSTFCFSLPLRPQVKQQKNRHIEMEMSHA